MTLVQRENVTHLVALSEDGYRCVGETDVEGPILLGNLPGAPHVIRGEWFEAVGASFDFLEQCVLSIRAHARSEEVVQLRENEGR